MGKIKINHQKLVGGDKLASNDAIKFYNRDEQDIQYLDLAGLSRWLESAVPPASSSFRLNAGGVYYMSDANPGAGVTVIATDNATKWLYQGNPALHAESGVLPTDTPLSHDEAETAQSSRLFHDFTGDSFEIIAERMRPIMLADRVSLLKLRNVTSGYFHSKDLTLPEIQAEMIEFGDALNGALAGSVESTLAALQAMRLAGTTYTEDFMSGAANQQNGPYNYRVTNTFWGWAYQFGALGFGGGISDLWYNGPTGTSWIQLPVRYQATALANLNIAGMKLQFHHPNFDTVSWDTNGNFVANGGNAVRWTGAPGDPENNRFGAGGIHRVAQHPPGNKEGIGIGQQRLDNFTRFLQLVGRTLEIPMIHR